VPKEKPKKTVKTVRFTTTVEPVAENTVTITTPVSLQDQRLALLRAHNMLLARHSLLHSTIESRALLPLDIQASRLPAIVRAVNPTERPSTRSLHDDAPIVHKARSDGPDGPHKARRIQRN
jgi:hypothetical protein